MNQRRRNLQNAHGSTTTARTWLQSTSQVLRFSASRAGEKNLPQIAASLTFTTVLAIVPLLAIVLSLFTAFPLFDDFRIALENFLAANLMPPTVSENVMSYLNQFAAQASSLTALGTLFLLVTSIMLMTTIEKAFNNIWNVTHRQPLRKRMLVYWAILSLGPILVGASLWATSYVARESFGQIARIPTSLSFALSLIPLIITGIGFSALFVGVPNLRINWKDALAGGFCTAIVLSIMKAGFAYYLVRFPSYTVIYGAFATLPIFLLWIYMSWLAILFGAMLAATLPLLRLRLWSRSHLAGASFVDAINVLRLLRHAQNDTNPARSLRFLGAHLHLHQDELIAVLDTLENLGYVVATQSKGDPRWAMVCDPATVGLGPIIDALLISRKQQGLLDDKALADAVCACLTQTHTIALKEVLDDRPIVSATGVIVQNNDVTTREAIRENSNAKSQ